MTGWPEIDAAMAEMGYEPVERWASPEGARRIAAPSGARKKKMKCVASYRLPPAEAGLLIGSAATRRECEDGGAALYAIWAAGTRKRGPQSDQSVEGRAAFLAAFAAGRARTLASREAKAAAEKTRADEAWAAKRAFDRAEDARALSEGFDSRFAMYRAAEKEVETKAAAARAAAKALRKRILASLRRLGFTREACTGRGLGSVYYSAWSNALNRYVKVRISNHEVPETDERRWNAENGGFTWATMGVQFILRGAPGEAFAAGRALVELRDCLTEPAAVK